MKYNLDDLRLESTMKSFIWGLSLFAFSSFLFLTTTHCETIRFGFLPIFSPATLVKLHKPLKDYLETELKITVDMVSSPDFKEFKERTKNLEYDLIFTAPHLARLAETEYHYQRIVVTAHRGSANFLVRTDEKVREIKDLKGLNIALPPASAIIHHMALRTLREKGLNPGTDIRIITTKTHNDPVLRLISNKVHSAAIGKAPWARMKEKAGDQVIVIDQSISIPGFMILSNPDMPVENIKKIRAILIKFHTTPEGEDYLKKSGYQNLIPISDQDMLEMDFYLQEMGMKLK